MTTVMQDHSYRGAESEGYGADESALNRKDGSTEDKRETNNQDKDSSIEESNSEKTPHDVTSPNEMSESRTDLVAEKPNTKSSIEIVKVAQDMNDGEMSKDDVRKKVLSEMFIRRKKLENAKNLIKRSKESLRLASFKSGKVKDSPGIARYKSGKDKDSPRIARYKSGKDNDSPRIARYKSGRDKESLRLANYKSDKDKESVRSTGSTNGSNMSSSLIKDTSHPTQHSSTKAKENDKLDDKQDIEIYTCGKCKTEFPAMGQLHDHMIKDEKVKGYKYNAENRIAHVDTDSDEIKQKTVSEIENTPKRRGRKRKIYSPDREDVTEDNKNRKTKKVPKKENTKKAKLEQQNSSNIGFDIDKADLTEKALLKFEKTVENKDEHSAFFDPVAHRYGTRRSSFLKLKEEITSPEKTKSRGKSKRQQKSRTNFFIKQHENEMDKEKEHNCNEKDKKKQNTNERGNKRKEQVNKRNEEIKQHTDEIDEQAVETSPESSILSALKLNRVKVEETKEDNEEDTHKIPTDSTEDSLENHIDISQVEGTSDNKVGREKPDGTMVYIKQEYMPEDEFEVLQESDDDYIPDEHDMKEDEEISPSDSAKLKFGKKQGTPSMIPCDICGKVFRRCSIARHMVKHSTARNVQCNICKKYYKTWAQCEDHKKKIHHDQEYVFKCNICQKVLKNKNNAVKHRTLHLFKGENPEIEMISKAEFENARAESSKKSDTSEQDQEKDVDNRQDNSNSSNKDATTNTDTQADSTTEDVQKPQKPRYRQEKLHPCKLCSKVFKKLYRLNDHIESYHDMKTYQCDICHAVLSTSRGLWTHKGRHLLDTDPYYSEEVASKIRMEHKKVVKKVKNPRMVICDICGKEVISKRLVRHMHSHNTSRDYECDICHKRYTTKRYVTDHKVKAHGNKTSFCDICGRTFKGTTYLEKHKQTHGPKDKFCDICGKGFTTDFYLRIHKVTHTNERRYKCTQCEAAFKHKARLDIHMVERHSKGQDRPCIYCGELFPSRQKARLHERKVHEGFTMPRTKKRSSLEPKVIEVEDNIHVQYAMEEPRRGITLKMQNEDSESVEQVIEIPENSQQCQLMILPNGVIKVLNVVEGDPESTTENVEENISIQYITEDGNQIEENGEEGVQYIEMEESEFKLLTANKDGNTEIVELVETVE